MRADADDPFDVGRRLRELRTQAGLSQRELARRSGITHTSVSLVELNQVSPSVASLKKMLSGFPMSLAEFFAVSEAEAPRIFYPASDLVELGDGALSLRQVGFDLRDRKLQMLYERYAPGADTGDPPYGHEGEEAGIVIAGAIELTVGEHVRVLNAGDAYYFDSTMLHRFRNIFADDCIIVSACTPPTF